MHAKLTEVSHDKPRHQRRKRAAWSVSPARRRATRRAGRRSCCGCPGHTSTPPLAPRNETGAAASDCSLSTCNADEQTTIARVVLSHLDNNRYHGRTVVASSSKMAYLLPCSYAAPLQFKSTLAEKTKQLGPRANKRPLCRSLCYGMATHSSAGITPPTQSTQSNTSYTIHKFP